MKLQRFIGLNKKYSESLKSSPYLKSVGIIKCNPERKGLINSAENWCVLNVDPEITRYYRTIVNNQYGINLSKPSWDSHITIIKGEVIEESLNDTLMVYDGLEVEFEYQVFPRYSGDTFSVGTTDVGWFWFLNVKCCFLQNLRDALNLHGKYRPHLTFGRKW
jgi:hypothetical protein